MAEVTQLKVLVDAYGVGVRAGVITPQPEDEAYFRELMDLPGMNSAVQTNWKEGGNVRKPITIKSDEHIQEEHESKIDGIGINNDDD